MKCPRCDYVWSPEQDHLALMLQQQSFQQQQNLQNLGSLGGVGGSILDGLGHFNPAPPQGLVPPTVYPLRFRLNPKVITIGIMIVLWLGKLMTDRGLIS